MAKNTQKLFEVELLEQAIVPVNEQPFKIPYNWIWTKLSNLVVVSKLKFDDFHESQDIKYVGLEHIQKNGGIIGYESAETVKSLKNVFKNDDILYGKLRPYLNKHAIADFEGICSTDIVVFSSRAISNNKYINYYMDTDWFIENSISNSKGINLPRVSADTILNSHIPLPPFDEQQRIVDKIESLFEKLDHAKELVQNALDSFENRKSAILHQAFSGELTKKWRESKNESMENWTMTKFGEIASIESNLVDPKKYLDFPHIAPDNIEKGTGRLLKYNTIREDCVFSNKHRFYPGQILYSKIRPYLSKVVIVDFDGLCSADMYPIETKEQTKYLWYFMLSDDFLEQASSAGSRSVLPKINQKELSALNVALTTIPEQEEVVRVLDNIFSKEEKAKELYDVIDRIDLMKKTILSRAFRGDLGTNDPYESSKLILKELLENSRSNTYSQKDKHIKSIEIDPEIERKLKTNIESKIYMLLLKKGKVEISDILTVSRNHLEISQSLSRLEKIDLIEKKNGLFFCK